MPRTSRTEPCDAPGALARAPMVSLLLLLSLTGCEDGPAQTFRPAPVGAGDRWNNGSSIPFVDNAYAEFIGPNGPPVPPTVCSPERKAIRWAALTQMPLSPPRQAAGVDLAGGDAWTGITVEQAEQANCQSDPAPDLFGRGNPTRTWGLQAEVAFEYLAASRRIVGLRVSAGYQGALSFASADGAHRFQVVPGAPILRDGAPLSLDWSAAGRRAFAAQADEITRALLFTFAPLLGADPPAVLCLDGGRCSRGQGEGGAAWLEVPVLGLRLWVDQPGVPALAAVVTRIDQRLGKILPWSGQSALLKLDASGPTAQAGALGGARACTLALGVRYGDFRAGCLQTTGEAARDLAQENQLLGGRGHDAQRFAFDLPGLRLDFLAAGLADGEVLRDADVPAAGDLATRLSVDAATAAPLANDRAGPNGQGGLDLHGTGAVYREYARLARARLLRLAGVADGDPRLCRWPVPLPPRFDPAAFLSALPPHCTGLEGLVTPAPPAAPGDPLDLGPERALSLLPGLARGLAPGHPQALLCLDATGDPATGYRTCAAGDLFPTSLAWVQHVLGRDRLAALPTAARDPRFYFQMYVRALLAYLQVGDQDPVPPLAGVALDGDSLLFGVDDDGADLARYVDRRFAAAQPPLTVVVRGDAQRGLIDRISLERALLRGETALEQAIAAAPGGVGQRADALLTSVFGSPLLAAAYHDARGGKSAWACATASPPDPAHCDGQTPPLDAQGQPLRDDQGRPLLGPYASAMGGASTPLTLGTTGVKVGGALPGLASAVVDLPQQDPMQPHRSALVPWWPAQPGLGFPIAIDGNTDRFISTSRFDLSGVTLSARVDYDVALDPLTHRPLPGGAQRLLAVESSGFWGEVFLCLDPRTGELLHARMATAATEVLGWLAAHPAAAAACDIVVGYAGPALAQVTSRRSGVRLAFGPAAAVTGATLFLPDL